MALSTPCDACQTSLRGPVVTVRFTTSAAITGAPGGASRPVPVGRPSEYLLCAACAAVLDNAIRLVAAYGGVPRSAAG